MPSMDYVKKRIIISMIAIVLLIITLFGITYAYFISKVKENQNDTSAEVSAANLELVYADGNGYIEVKGIEPGSTIKSKTFTVQNAGTREVENYDVYLEDIINELEFYEDLTYELTCKSYNSEDYKTNKENASEVGVCNSSSGVFPKKDSIIGTNSIDVGIIHVYTLTLIYEETEENQSKDMNKNITARVNIKHDGKKIKSLLVYGNSIQNGEPTPENPVEILSLGDRTKNLFDVKTYVNNANHSTITLIENGFSQKTITYQEKIDKMYFSLKTNTSYTFSSDVNWKSYSDSRAQTGFRFYYSDGTYDRTYIDINDTNHTFTTKSSKTLVAISSGGWQYNGEVEFTNIQLEEGISKTEYEPYGYKIPISVKGKNLFDINNYGGQNPSYFDISNYQVGTTITISTKDEYCFKIASGAGETLANEGVLQKRGKSATFTLTENNIKKGKLYIISTNTWTTETKENLMQQNVQIEYGETPTNYVPYTTTHNQTYYVYAQEPLRSVGNCDNCSDYIDYNNKHIVRYIKTIEFDGNENWVNSDNSLTNTFRASIRLDDVLSGGTNIPNYTNKFESILSGTSSNDTENAQISSKSLYVRVLRNRLNDISIDGFKTWLNSNNFITYYPTITPQYEQVEMPNIRLSPADTVLSVCDSNNICASKIEVEYQ